MPKFTITYKVEASGKFEVEADNDAMALLAFYDTGADELLNEKTPNRADVLDWEMHIEKVNADEEIQRN